MHGSIQPRALQNGCYHDGNCKGPSQIKCCLVDANNGGKTNNVVNHLVSKYRCVHQMPATNAISTIIRVSTKHEHCKTRSEPYPKSLYPDKKHIYPRCKAHKGSVWAFCGKIEVKKWGIGKKENAKQL